MNHSDFHRRAVRLVLLSLTLLFSAFGTLLLAQPEQLNQGLVGYWRFDEGTGTIVRDETSFRNDGQLKGPNWVIGLIEFGLNYYGREGFQVVVPHAQSLAVEKELTLACWVCLNEGLARNKEDDLFYLFAKSSTGVYSLGIEREDLQLRGSVSTGGDYKAITSEESVPTGRWVHTAFTYNSSTGEARLYIDGRLDRTLQLQPGLIDVNQTSLFLGSAVDPTTGKRGVGVLPGIMDEARVYERILSEEEITQLVSAPTTAPDRPCSNCYVPRNVGDLILNLLPEASITQGQFIRWLFALLNQSQTLPLDADIEEIIQFLVTIHIIPSIFPIDLEAPITKGAAALLLLRALELQVSFIDQLLITVGLKQAEEAAFVIAVREGLISGGRPDDLVTGRDLANMSLFLLERLQVSPPHDFTPTDIACAVLKLVFIKTVVTPPPPLPPGS